MTWFDATLANIGLAQDDTPPAPAMTQAPGTALGGGAASGFIGGAPTVDVWSAATGATNAANELSTDVSNAIDDAISGTGRVAQAFGFAVGDALRRALWIFAGLAIVAIVAWVLIAYKVIPILPVVAKSVAKAAESVPIPG